MSDDQVIEQKPLEEAYPDPAYKEMADVGLFYGRKRSKTNPKMRPYILGNRNEIEIINLAKTKEVLETALAFLGEKVKAGGQVLLVGTQPAAQGVTDLAKELNLPLVSNRWIGGTLTNWKVISTRIEYFKKLKADMASGNLGKYTKKERLNFDREIESLRMKFEGVKNMEKLPEAVFIVGIDKNMAVIQEAKRMGIKIIGVIDTNINPEVADYPIPANDDAISSVTYILEKIKATIINK